MTSRPRTLPFSAASSTTPRPEEVETIYDEWNKQGRAPGEPLLKGDMIRKLTGSKGSTARHGDEVDTRPPPLHRATRPDTNTNATTQSRHGETVATSPTSQEGTLAGPVTVHRAVPEVDAA